MAKRAWRALAILVTAVALFGAAVLAIAVGQVSIPLDTTAAILLSKIPPLNLIFNPNWPTAYEVIVMDIRLPRILLGVLVGAALASSGAVMQGTFRNPLADPYVLGLAAGAAFGASISMVLGLSLGFGFAKYSTPFLAFIFTLLTAFLVYSIARVGKKVPTSTLLLAGIAVGTFFWAINSFMQYLAGEKLQAVIFWIMGGLWQASWDDVVLSAPPIILGVALIMLFSKDLNAMLMGEEVASSLGVNVEFAMRALIILSSLLVASAVAVSGTIGFVGLVIPHMLRLIVGPDHRILLPTSCLFGATFLVLADLAAKLVVAPAELPVGIITASIGAPFFIYLLRTRKRTIGLGGRMVS
ncbi:MAG: iron chelate uptake ABC transporter family permease subunit [archaeon]|nr:iron chelate uptake ABC transporter family permease subunit [archaeon]